jgi:Fuc2NAc and GlcNAc transferase
MAGIEAERLPAVIMAAAVAGVLSGLLIPALERWARTRGLLDVPNARSSHRNPTPRVGGVAMVAAVFMGLGAARVPGCPSMPHVAALAAGSLAIASISLVDDVHSLPALWRLAGHTAVAVGMVIALGSRQDDVVVDAFRGLAPLILVVWITGFVNAYNFMDGVDGLAGGLAVVSCIGWAFVGILAGSASLTTPAVVVGTVSAVFLYFNWQPARIFMGDTGSAFLGFVFAVMPLIDPSPGRLVAGALFAWPVIFDTGLTLTWRLAHGENLLTAHRTHLYQRLTATGFSHGRVTVLYMGLGSLGLPAGVCAAIGAPLVAWLLGGVVSVTAFALWRLVTVSEATAGAAPAGE